MLQWMGGSRRNVATSRNSTLKRQKQYFEQRRRQQQKSGVEEGTTVNTGSKRSLDILSLLDLPSTFSHRCSASASSCNDLSRPEQPPTNGDRGSGFRTGECDVRKDPPMPPTDIEESRAPSRCRMETVSTEKEFVTFPNGHTGAIKPVNEKINMQNSAPYTYSNAPCKAANKSVPLDANQSELSIFDLLVADEPCGDFEHIPAKEDHVAFSVEGLGKVGAETPVRSPQPPTRHVNRAVSLKLKDAKRANQTKSLNAMFNEVELELDEMMQNIGMPLSGSSSKIYRQNQCNEFEERLSPPSNYKQYKGPSLKTGNSLLDDWNNEKWNDAGLLEGRKQFVSQKRWMSPICGDHTDFMDDDNDAAYAFHGPDRWDRNRLTWNFQESTERFNFREGARYRTAAPTFDFWIDPFQPDWSGPLDRDEREAMSSLSEESCSTAAVRSKRNQMSRQSSTTGHGRIDPNTVHRFEVKDDPAIIWDDVCEGNVYRPGEHSRQPITSKFRSTLEHDSPPHFKSGEGSFWPFEEGYKSLHLDWDSEAPKSERKQPFSCYNLSTDSGIGGCLASERDLDAQFAPDNLKPGSTLVLSGTSDTESLVMGKPSGGNQAPSSSQHVFESPKAANHSDFQLKDRLHVSSDALCEGENPVPNQLADLGRHKRSVWVVEEPNYDGGKASQLQTCAEFCDAKDGSLETLASMNVPDESGSNEPKQEFDNAPYPDRKENSAKSSDGAADRSMMTSRVNVGHIESSSTIMLGTCIFQLACAQKVAKEALLRGP